MRTAEPPQRILPHIALEAGEFDRAIAELEKGHTFLVNLGVSEGGAVIGDGQGVVTTLDDEPRVSINDVSKNEGNSGTAQFVFTVSLSARQTPRSA